MLICAVPKVILRRNWKSRLKPSKASPCPTDGSTTEEQDNRTSENPILANFAF
jgi:hypothetical protein